MRIVLIGAGNLATPVGRALASAGHEIVQVWSHNRENAEALANQLSTNGALTEHQRSTNGAPRRQDVVLTDLKNIRPDADLYLYAVRDAYLQQVVDEVAHYTPLPTGEGPGVRLHAHTAGSMGLSVFEGRQEHGAVFYPYQSFSKQRMPDFHEVPIFLETAQAADYPTLEALARSISPKVYAANSEQRRRIHLAGVFANNFTNAMYRICQEQINAADLPFSTMLGLIDETARKVHYMSPREAQTGPAKRHDQNVMAEHLSMLNPQERAIYEAISEYIKTNL